MFCSSEVSSQSSLKKWTDHSIRRVEALNRVISNSDNQSTYLESVYRRFASQLVAGWRKPQEVLEQAIARLTKIQQELEQCSAAVLQEAGVGVELIAIDGEVKWVRRVQQHLEEMLCEAMIDPNELIAAHNTNQLTYQRI